MYLSGVKSWLHQFSTRIQKWKSSLTIGDTD